MSAADVTPRRHNGRTRPKGYAEWRPSAPVRVILEQIDEILTEYQAQLPLTARQVFYRLVGAYGYAKTEKDYKRLTGYLVRARRARMIPFESIRDDGIVKHASRFHAGPEDFWDDAAHRAQSYRRDRQAGQPAYIELWTEAAGMAPQLARVADEYAVPVFSAGGFSSLTAVRSIAYRATKRDVPTIVLHVGDLDPSGESIFESMTEDARQFVLADRVIGTQDIIPMRVALTAEQVETYDLPTAPPKTSDTRSARWTGETAQAEALPPNLLATIVEHAIVRQFDHGRLAREIELEQDDQTQILRALPRGE